MRAALYPHDDMTGRPTSDIDFGRHSEVYRRIEPFAVIERSRAGVDVSAEASRVMRQREEAVRGLQLLIGAASLIA